MNNKKIPQICIIAGSDPLGGAGIQADLRMATLLGCSASTVITCITVQDLQGVYDSLYVPDKIIAGQLMCALSMQPDAIKIGMLGNIEVTRTVLEGINDLSVPIVLDPVLVSTSRSSLLKKEAFSVLVEDVIPKAYLVTPNLREAAIISGILINTEKDLISAAEYFISLGAKNVLIKGFESEKTIRDLLLSSAPLKVNRETIPKQSFSFLSSKSMMFHHSKIAVSTTHGTGCRLSSAIACHIAIGHTLEDSIDKSITTIESEIIRMQKIYSGITGKVPRDLIASFKG